MKPLEQCRRIHLIGIKGAGMTGLAQVFLGLGKTVTGSDVGDVFFTDTVLAQAGVTVLPFARANITPQIDLVVYSTAYGPDHPERVAADELGIESCSYPQAVGLFFTDHYGIAVCGTHGKTTTTGMLGYVFQELGVDPLVIVGSSVPQLGGNARYGRGKYYVLEADEYQNKLRHYSPQAVILTSADWDHPDYFPNQEAYTQVFVDFVKRIPPEGILVAFTDDDQVEQIARQATCRVIRYGVGENKQPIGSGVLLQTTDGKYILQRRDGSAKKNSNRIAPFGGRMSSQDADTRATAVRELREEIELTVTPEQLQSLGVFRGQIDPSDWIEVFTGPVVDPTTLKLHEGAEVVVYTREELMADPLVTDFTRDVIRRLAVPETWSLQVPGEHNEWNATAVLLLLQELGFDPKNVAELLKSFQGAKRRFELLGTVENVSVYDDYAHHPREIEKLLTAARAKFPKRRLWAVFQPHTYSRTIALLDQFAEALTLADEVIILDIFASAREQEATIDATDLVAAITARGGKAAYRGSISRVVEFLTGMVRPGDVVLTIGAGENWRVGQGLVEALENLET